MVTDYEGATIVVAGDGGTAQADLRVVATHLAGRACVGGIVVVLLLADPGIHSVSRGYRGAGQKEVLPIRTT